MSWFSDFSGADVAQIIWALVGALAALEMTRRFYVGEWFGAAFMAAIVAFCVFRLFTSEGDTS
jgi:hypothetical protein